MFAARLGQAEEVAPLSNEDDDADACREADNDRCGNELDHGAQT